MEEQRLDLTLFSEKIERLRQEIAKVIVGQDEAIELVLTSILANGHVLIEGVPGVAKTLLARLIARLVDAGFSRTDGLCCEYGIAVMDRESFVFIYFDMGQDIFVFLWQFCQALCIIVIISFCSRIGTNSY